MVRDLYFVISRFVGRHTLKPVWHGGFSTQVNEESVLDVLNVILRSLPSVKAAATGQPAPPAPRDVTTDDVRFVSWSLAEVLSDLPACAVPKPGIVFVVLRPEDTSTPWPPQTNDLITAVAAIKMRVDGDPSSARIRAFGSSPAAHVDPILPPGNRVFISYATTDVGLAAEMKDLLEKRGLKCFMADLSIKPGEEWSDTIRQELRASTAALLLLTPHSVERPWVMAEAGALWALEIPFVPAVQYVSHDRLPELIVHRKSIDIRTVNDREKCAEAVLALCKPRP